MELTLTHHMVDNVEPQDEAMDQFRRMFKLVAGCNVSDDGKVMVYQMRTVASAARWLSDAKSVINSKRLPLEAGVKAKMKGRVAESVTLVITYTP